MAYAVMPHSEYISSTCGTAMREIQTELDGYNEATPRRAEPAKDAWKSKEATRLTRIGQLRMTGYRVRLEML
jgi:hypothetical protein